MWPVLTPEERRGGLVVVLLLLIGAGWDAFRAATLPPAPGGSAHPGAAIVQTATPVDSARPHPGAAPAVDLNRAGPAELDRLPGIGPVLAARIVEHRRRHGRFGSVEELRAVRGVGPRMLERLRPLVTAAP